MLRLIGLALVWITVLASAPYAKVGSKPSQPRMLWYGSGYLWTSALGAPDSRVAQADTTKTEKKKRQKKRTPVTPQQHSDTDTDTHKEKDDDEDMFGACLGGCLGVMLESFCSSLFGDDESQVTETAVPLDSGEPPAPGTTVETVPPVTSPALLALPYLAVLKPLNPYDSAIDLWDVPGGADAGGEMITELPRGSRVHVVERDMYDNAKWVKVRGAEVPEPGGWLQERDVSPYTASPEYAEPGTPDDAVVTGDEEQRIADIKNVRWSLLADLSFPLFGNTMLSEEYKSAIRVGAESRFFFVHSLQAGLSFGFSHSEGEPQYDYVTSETREAPVESDLDIWSIGVRAGQLFAFPTGNSYFFISYDLGPVVFNVRESATLEIYEGKEMTGTREEKLSEWKIGGDLKLEIGSIIKGQFPLSFHTRFSIIPWDGKEEKSLTLDFLNDNSIYVFNFGVSFGYMFY